MKIIVNPIAEAGAVGKRWPLIREFLLAQGASFDAVLTEGIGHATELAQLALEEGHETIVVVGGDGTLNEVVNGLFFEGRIPPNVSIGVIPGGTGADFVRTLGISHDYEEACRCLLEGETRPIDIGEIVCVREGKEVRRYFINVAGLGFDGEVAERVNRYAWKWLGGTIPYLTGLLVTLITYKNKSIEISFDGEEMRGKATSVIACNCRYFGGGMKIAPNASPDDGFFDLVVIGDLGKMEFLANVPKVYKGTHLTHPKVYEYRGIKEVRVESKERMLLQADGELIGESPASFRIIHRALRVIVPS